jgi:hypothetical protein
MIAPAGMTPSPATSVLLFGDQKTQVEVRPQHEKCEEEVIRRETWSATSTSGMIPTSVMSRFKSA